MIGSRFDFEWLSLTGLHAPVGAGHIFQSFMFPWMCSQPLLMVDLSSRSHGLQIVMFPGDPKQGQEFDGKGDASDVDQTKKHPI